MSRGLRVLIDDLQIDDVRRAIRRVFRRAIRSGMGERMIRFLRIGADFMKKNVINKIMLIIKLCQKTTLRATLRIALRTSPICNHQSKNQP